MSEDDINDQLVLISGESGTGKSASLINLKNPEKVMYLNCEAGKRLPFRNKFQPFKITDPLQIFEAFDYARDNPDDVKTIVIDTLTFLMDMYESQYINGAANTMKAWGDYNQYFKKLMQEYVSTSDCSVLILAHTKDELNEAEMKMKTSVPIKGALKNNGIEAFEESALAA